MHGVHSGKPFGIGISIYSYFINTKKKQSFHLTIMIMMIMMYLICICRAMHPVLFNILQELEESLLHGEDEIAADRKYQQLIQSQLPNYQVNSSEKFKDSIFYLL